MPLEYALLLPKVFVTLFLSCLVLRISLHKHAVVSAVLVATRISQWMM